MTAIETLKSDCGFYQVCNDCKGDDCKGCYITEAIAALEKQIPKKPNKGNHLRRQNSYEFVNLCCPSCGEDVGEMETYIKLNAWHHRFCTGCGQAIDWSEVGE